MKKTLISYKGATEIIGVYFIFVILGMVAITDFEWMVSYGIFGMVIMFVHLVANRKTQELRFWEELSDHFFIVDWGPFGRNAWKMLPKQLRQYVLFVPGSKVRSQAEEISDMLCKSGNPMYQPEGKIGVEVKMIWFARGEHVGEKWKPKKYKQRVFEEITSAMKELHTTIDQASPESGFKKEAYENIFINTHLNGSVS